MKTLLVPVDFSDATQNVLQKAAELAQELSAKIILLHISEPVAAYVPAGATIDVITAAPPAVESENIGVQEERLADLARPLKASGLDVECVAFVGLAVDDILEQAARHNADYIVLGSHGHGALYHLFSGSVVTAVLKRAVCPVLVVPARKS